MRRFRVDLFATYDLQCLRSDSTLNRVGVVGGEDRVFLETVSHGTYCDEFGIEWNDAEYFNFQFCFEL